MAKAYPYQFEDGTYAFVDDNGDIVTDLSGYDISDGSQDQPAATQSFIPKREYSDKGENRKVQEVYKETPRTMSNNFGYEKKPLIAKAMGFLPGPAGLAGKAINLAMNANNKVAINKARETLGLPETGKLDNLIKDNKGKVADVKINDQNYAVGFEAKDKKGRTTLTPNEARTRSLLGGGISELNRGEVKDEVNKFKADKKSETVDKVPSYMVGDHSTAGAGASANGNITFDLSRNIFNPELDINTSASDNVVSMGLADISPSFKDLVDTGINYSHPDRGPVKAGLNQRTSEVMDSLAQFQPGGINVTSAFRGQIDPNTGMTVNEAVGGSPHSNHLTGEAFDLSTKGLDPTQKRDLIERAIMSGAEGIGTYPDGSLHIDSRARYDPLNGQNTGGVTAMFDRSRYNYSNAPDWFKSGIEESRLAPIPQEKPRAPIIEEFPTKTAVGQNPFENIQSGIVDQKANSQPQVGARWSDYNDENKALMAMTLAGEIDPRKTDLTTPQGRQEAMAILSTIENRAPKYGSIDKVITAPNQYSTWNNQSAANTAKNNYGLNSDLYNNLVNDFISDPKSNLGFTSYHANYVNPGWSGTMSNSQVIGQHKFGSLPEYNKGFTDPVQPRTVFNTPNTTTSTANSGFMTQAQSSLPTTNSKDPISDSSTKSLSKDTTKDTSNKDKGENRTTSFTDKKTNSDKEFESKSGYPQ